MVDFKFSFSHYDNFAVLIIGILALGASLIPIPISYIINFANTIETFIELKYLFLFFLGIIILFVSYLVGLLISFLGSVLIERFLINKILKYPTANLFSEKKEKITGIFKNYRCPYSKKFQSDFKRKFNDVFAEGFEFQENQDDVFKLCFHVVKEQCPISYGRLTTFITLYDLNRNLVILFNLFFIEFLIYSILNPIFLNIVICIFSIPFAFFCLLNYLRYFKIYADEVFRSFYTYQIQQKKTT